MWKVSEGICLIWLILLSVKDIKTREVPPILLAAAGAGSVWYQSIFQREGFWIAAGGAAIGILFLLVSKWTKEGMGYGDSLGICVLGIFLGFYRVITVLVTSFFLLFLFSIPLLIKKNMSRKITVPFYPFLTGGYLCLLITERMAV